MPQSLFCPRCGKSLQVADEMAARSVRCPFCREVFVVPGAGSRQQATVGIAAAHPPRSEPFPGPSLGGGRQPPLPAAVPSVAAPARLCPACQAPLLPEAISCMDCGYLLASPTAAAPAPSPPLTAPLAILLTNTPAPAGSPAVLAPGPPAPKASPAPADALARHWADWGHWLPAGLLAMMLGSFIIRDMLIPHEGPAEQNTGLEMPVDPDPLLLIHWNAQTGQFGLVMAREKDNRGNPKRLTFSETGESNYPCARIDDIPYVVGQFHIVHGGLEKTDGHLQQVASGSSNKEFVPGQWKDPPALLDKDRLGRQRQGMQGTWLFDRQQIWITQTVQVVPGEPSSPEEQKRYLDTCLVRYRMENKDDQQHRVGFRFLLDTYIGANDGVPFTIPGMSLLCDSEHDFRTPGEVPDFLQALEFPSLKSHGTVAHLTLKVGGQVQPPSRVTLGHWSSENVVTVDGEWRPRNYEMPVVPIGGDSSVTMYWEDRPLAPGESREVGFAYGLGQVSSAQANGRLGVTVGGSFKPGEEFTVTAYVHNPLSAETVSLELPPGCEPASGEARQQVPPIPAGAGSENSPVTWKVKAVRVGRYSLKVVSSTGVGQAVTITIKNSGIFE